MVSNWKRREKERETDLVHYVFERVRAVDGEADKDEVGFGVREWAEPVVLLLPGRVPERQLHRLTGWRGYRVGDVILKDGRDVFLRACQSGMVQSLQVSARTSGKYPWL